MPMNSRLSFIELTIEEDISKTMKFCEIGKKNSMREDTSKLMNVCYQ